MTAILAVAARNGDCTVSQLLGLEFGDVGSWWRICGATDASELLMEARYFAFQSAPDASFNHFGADVEPNVAASHVKNDSKVRAKRTQGTLARPREAKVGTGNSLAKS